MGFAVDAIDDNAGDIQAGVEVLKSHHRGGDGGGNRFAIYQQNDRTAELFSHRGGAAVVRVGTEAVIQPHHALNDRDIRPLHPFAKQRIEHRFREHKAVEVAGSDAADGGVPAGIEVVRADFAGLNPHTALLQQAEQTKRNGGFTTTAAGTCENKCVLPGCHTPILCRVVGLRAFPVFRLYASEQPTSHRSC